MRACGSSPRGAVSSAASARSTTRWVHCLRQPCSPRISGGAVYSFRSASNIASCFAVFLVISPSSGWSHRITSYTVHCTPPPTGRIFGSLCEVRWQRDGKLFHTLLVGNIVQPPVPSITYHQELFTTDFDYVAQQYYLWGAWSNELPEWVEASIPHRFDYPSPPVQGTWRRKLAVLEYLHRHTGEMEFYRFMSLDMEQL